MSEELIFSETETCSMLASQIDENYRVHLMEMQDGSWSVSIQTLADALSGRPLNLLYSVNSPSRLGAWQAMRAQLEAMLAE